MPYSFFYTTSLLCTAYENYDESNVFGSRRSCLVETTPTPEKSVRLAPEDPADRIDHRVDVYVNGQWGTFCIRNFTLLEGDVVCKQMGFPVITKVKDINDRLASLVS